MRPSDVLTSTRDVVYRIILAIHATSLGAFRSVVRGADIDGIDLNILIDRALEKHGLMLGPFAMKDVCFWALLLKS